MQTWVILVCLSICTCPNLRLWLDEPQSRLLMLICRSYVNWLMPSCIRLYKVTPVIAVSGWNRSRELTVRHDDDAVIQMWSTSAALWVATCL